MAHVGGKRRKALLDALLVADVGIDFPIHRHLRADGGGHEKPGLRHQRKQPQRLHTDGLAAGVWPGDEQHAKIAAYGQINRHDLLVRDQRMTRLFDMHAPLPVHLRARSAELSRQPRLREGKIQPRQDRKVLLQHVGVPPDVGGQPAQDARDLLPLRKRQLLDVVVQRNDLHRLDEKRRAGGGLVVHDARHRLPVFLLDGNHIAIPAHGDDGVLQIFLLRRGVDHRGKRVLDFLLRDADAPTELRQRHAGVVAERAVFVDGVAEAVFKLPQDFQRSRPFLQRRR